MSCSFMNKRLVHLFLNNINYENIKMAVIRNVKMASLS